MERDKIYCINLYSENPNIFFEILLLPAKNDIIDYATIEYEYLPSEALVFEEVNIESNFADKFMIGNAMADALQLKFNLTYTSEDFQKVILNTYTDEPMWVYEDESELYLCNLLYFNKVTIEEEGIYKRKGLGVFIQERQAENEFTIGHSRAMYNVSFLSAVKYILANIRTEIIVSKMTPAIEDVSFAIDYVINLKDSDKLKADTPNNPNKKQHDVYHILIGSTFFEEEPDYKPTPIYANNFYKLKDIDDAIIYFANVFYSKLARAEPPDDYDFKFFRMNNNPFVAINYFRQLITDNNNDARKYRPNYNSRVVYSDLYLHENYFNAQLKYNLFDLKNAWDYWLSCCENNVCKLSFNLVLSAAEDRILEPAILFCCFDKIKNKKSMTSSGRKSIFLSENISNELTLKLGELQIRGANAETGFQGEEEVSEVSFVEAGSLASEEYDIKTLFHTACTSAKWSDMVTNPNFKKGAYSNTYLILSQLDHRKLYYRTSLNSPHGSWGESTKNMIKVHNLVRLSYDDDEPLFENSSYEKRRFDLFNYLIEDLDILKAIVNDANQWTTDGTPLVYNSYQKYNQSCFDLQVKTRLITYLFNKDYLILELELPLFHTDLLPNDLADRVNIDFENLFDNLEGSSQFLYIKEYLERHKEYGFLHSLNYDLVERKIKIKLIWD